MGLFWSISSLIIDYKCYKDLFHIKGCASEYCKMPTNEFIPVMPCQNVSTPVKSLYPILELSPIVLNVNTPRAIYHPNKESFNFCPILCGTPCAHYTSH